MRPAEELDMLKAEAEAVAVSREIFKNCPHLSVISNHYVFNGPVIQHRRGVL